MVHWRFAREVGGYGERRRRRGGSWVSTTAMVSRQTQVSESIYD